MRVLWELVEEVRPDLREAIEGRLQRIKTNDEVLSSVQFAERPLDGSIREVRVTAQMGKRKVVVARRGDTDERALLMAMAALESTLRTMIEGVPGAAARGVPAPVRATAPVQPRRVSEPLPVEPLNGAGRGDESGGGGLSPQLASVLGSVQTPVQRALDSALGSGLRERGPSAAPPSIRRRAREARPVETRPVVEASRPLRSAAAAEAAPVLEQPVLPEFDLQEPAPTTEFRLRETARTRTRRVPARPTQQKGWILRATAAIVATAAGLALHAWWLDFSLDRPAYQAMSADSRAYTSTALGPLGFSAMAASPVGFAAVAGGPSAFQARSGLGTRRIADSRPEIPSFSAITGLRPPLQRLAAPR